MRLHDISNSDGATHATKRLGRGEGGGLGKTSGRGHKGQRSRAGFSQRPGFESGHIPLYRKLPTRGFSNYKFRTDYVGVNVGDLADIEGTTDITKEVMAATGLIRKPTELVKILGDGELATALNVTADKFSKTAKSKIEAAGGKAIVAGAAAEATEEPAAEADAAPADAES